MRTTAVLPVALLACLVCLVDGVPSTGVTRDYNLEWWRTALVYQIYPRSFMDSDGDGIGDLNGITSKLPYLRELGVDALWMSPIFLSPMVDFGYDITDYRKISPEYGTMDDFDRLLNESNKLGIKVLLDYVPNHTSNDSEWFLKSAQRDPQYENYYIWADGTLDSQNRTQPPNNWISIFRGSAWEYNSQRGQYFLHQFVIGQPDLNYREPRVQREMKDVLRFWLDKGVSGFRVDAINMMYEVDPKDFGGRFPDEPLADNSDPNIGPDDYEYLNHIYSKDLPETYKVVYDFRDVLNEYIQKQGEYKIMMTEAYTNLADMMRYYGDGRRNGSIPFNFAYLGELHNTSNAWDMKTIIDKWMTYMPPDMPANWVNGNHDQSRMASRHGTDRVDAMNMMSLLLPGVTIVYQGEEIGMTDGYVSWEDTVDPQACNTEDPVNYWKKSRDPNRTPMHWDASANAGFSNTTGRPWLPVADNYKTVNVALQIHDSRSHYTFYKDVAAAKRTDAVRYGDLDTRTIGQNVLVIARLLPDTPGVVGVINLAGTSQAVDLSSIKLLPNQLEVIASGVDCTLLKGSNVNKNSVQTSGHCALVLQTTSNCC